jgi:hypothetical protein
MSVNVTVVVNENPVSVTASPVNALVNVSTDTFASQRAVQAAEDAESARDEIVDKVVFEPANDNDVLTFNSVTGKFEPEAPSGGGGSLPAPYTEFNVLRANGAEFESISDVDLLQRKGSFEKSPILTFINETTADSLDWGNTSLNNSIGTNQEFTLIDGYKTLLRESRFGTMTISWFVAASDSSNNVDIAFIVDEDNYYNIRFNRSNAVFSKKILGVTTVLGTTAIALASISRTYQQIVTFAWSRDSISNIFNIGGSTVNKVFFNSDSTDVFLRDSIVRVGIKTTSGVVTFLIRA